MTFDVYKIELPYDPDRVFKTAVVDSGEVTDGSLTTVARLIESKTVSENCAKHYGPEAEARVFEFRQIIQAQRP